MKYRGFLTIVFAAFSTHPALAQVWSVDSPTPPQLAKRVFADPASVAVYQDKADELVGRWGILRPDGVVEITGDRPSSFGTSTVPVVKVTLSDTKPVFRTVLSKSSGVKAVIPVMDISFGANERAAMTVTDVAQFIVSSMPNNADWGVNAPDPGPAKPRLVYIGAALLSTAELAVLRKKTGGFSAFFMGLNLGAAGNFEEDKSSITHVLSIAVYEPTCRKLGNCTSSAVTNANLSPVAETIKSVSISNDSAANTLENKP